MNKRKRDDDDDDKPQFGLEVHPGLEVTEVKHKPRKKFKCNLLLPQPPFLLLMAAPRFSGKTNLLIKMLIDNEMYCKKFDEIFIWSKSFHNDDKWRAIHFDDEYLKDHVFTSFNEAKVKKWFLDMQARSKKKPLNVLAIFDDMMGEGIMNSHKIQTLDNVASTGRHFDISVVIIFQKYMRFTPIIRDNATNVAVFEQKNTKSLEQIAEEYKGTLTLKDFVKIYRFATSEPFGFLHINLQVPQEKRFRKNWNTIITVK